MGASPIATALARLAPLPWAPLFVGDDAVAWPALDARARGYAGWLQAQGAVAGDRVVLAVEPGVDHVAALLAHLRLGLVHVPVAPRSAAAELAHVVADAGARLVVREVAAAAPLAAWPAPPAAVAPAVIFYTSGTTGRPKGATHTHGGLDAGLGAVMRAWAISAGDVVVATLPLYHVHGLGLTVLGPLLAGASVDLHPRFDVVGLLAALRRPPPSAPTVLMAVPTLYHRLLEHLAGHPEDAAPLRELRLCTSGSAPLPAADFARWEAVTGHRLLERYGMTETLFTLSNAYDGERRPGAVGTPLPGVTARLVDEHGAPAGDGPGEIEVRAPWLFDGYWGQPEATAAAWRDGWFRTGDTAVIEAGAWRIVGRTSTDIIKSGGYKLGAGEIEAALLATGDFVEVAVLGAPEPRWGEVVVAVVVPRPGGPALDEAGWVARLRGALGGTLVDYKQPRRVIVVDALPRTALGKVQKAALRPLLAGGAA